MSSLLFSRNFQNLGFQKNYMGMYFPSLVDNKELFEKIKSNLKKRGPKTLLEFKKFAIEEGKRQYNKNSIKNKTKRNKEITILDKEIVKNTLLAIYNFLDMHLKVLNNEYKFERRKHFNDDSLYFETINKFENRKLKYIEYTVKSFCNNFKFGYELFEKSVLYFIENNNEEIISLINSFKDIGMPKVYAPKRLPLEIIISILKIYEDNINFISENGNSNNKGEFFNYIFTLINDLIYIEHGIEEENILAYLEEDNLNDNDVIKNKLILIKELLHRNIKFIFNFK